MFRILNGFLDKGEEVGDSTFSRTLLIALSASSSSSLASSTMGLEAIGAWMPAAAEAAARWEAMAGMKAEVMRGLDETSRLEREEGMHELELSSESGVTAKLQS